MDVDESSLVMMMTMMMRRLVKTGVDLRSLLVVMMDGFAPALRIRTGRVDSFDRRTGRGLLVRSVAAGFLGQLPPAVIVCSRDVRRQSTEL
jgi:hypothetical protein